MDSKKTSESVDKPKSRRGFAAMSPEKREAISSLGGKAAHAKGVAHQFNSETGAVAGRIPHQKGTAHAFTEDEVRRGVHSLRKRPKMSLEEIIEARRAGKSVEEIAEIAAARRAVEQ